MHKPSRILVSAIACLFVFNVSVGATINPLGIVVQAKKADVLAGGTFFDGTTVRSVKGGSATLVFSRSRTSLLLGEDTQVTVRNLADRPVTELHSGTIRVSCRASELCSILALGASISGAGEEPVDTQVRLISNNAFEVAVLGGPMIVEAEEGSLLVPKGSVMTLEASPAQEPQGAGKERARRARMIALIGAGVIGGITTAAIILNNCCDEPRFASPVVP